MGGKHNQSKIIVDEILCRKSTQTVYVEPFCGAISVAKKLVNKFDTIILADNNKHIITLLQALVDDKFEPYVWETQEKAEADYIKYKENIDASYCDPMMAFWGHGMSFGGKWFGGLARDKRYDICQPSKIFCIRANESLLNIQSQLKKIKCLKLLNIDYQQLIIPNNSIVYCDPPYANRTKAHAKTKEFNHSEYWQWVRDISSDNLVLASEFIIPNDFEVIHNWGDTIVRHYAGKDSDGTQEVLCTLPNK